MPLNTNSETSPTGGTLTLNTQYDPSVWDRRGSNFLVVQDASAVYGGHFPSDPYRPAQYMQNWSGVSQYQTWDSLGGMWNGIGDFPTEYRNYIVAGNVNDTNMLLLYRNAPAQYAPAPIAISQYALNTQQVYVGSDYSGGF